MAYSRMSLFIVMMFAGFSYMFGQDSVILSPGIRMPLDTVAKKHLLVSLNQFIRQKDHPNKENQYVLSADLLYTSALLDEFKHMETNAAGHMPALFSAYVNNLVALNDSSFLIQLSYMGVNGDTAVLRASFDILAKKGPDHFYFCSPLVTKTYYWKTETLGSTTFHFKWQLDRAKANSYAFYDSLYNRKLKIEHQSTQFYGADNMPDALQLLGVSYKRDYNGYGYNSFSAFENGVFLRVSGVTNTGFPNFDPHDMWHEKLRTVVSVSVINRPVDEGCAYLYGGSWGLPWKEILTAFKSYAAANPQSDWLDLYKGGAQFPTGRYPNGIANIINALIVQKLEKEKGFDSVMALIQCGPREKGDANYFITLEKVSGISQKDFNREVWLLIKQNS